MSLKEWSIPKTSFPLPGGGEIAVRGVSVELVEALVREEREALVGVFDKVMGRADVKALAEQVSKGEEVSVDVADLGAGDMALVTLQAAPRLVAKIIAWAADEPDAVDVAAQIPFPTQLELLVEIGRLTFETTAPGKFMETVVSLIRSARLGVSAAQSLR